jgi:hypothetical protein
MSIPDALTAFAETPTTTVTILEIKTDAILDSDNWGLRQASGPSIHPSRKTSKRLLSSKKANIRADRALLLGKVSRYITLEIMYGKSYYVRYVIPLIFNVFCPSGRYYEMIQHDRSDSFQYIIIHRFK